MIRWLKRIGIGLAVLTVALAAVAWALLGTTWGARVLVGQLLPEGATVDRVEGRVWGDITLRGLRFETPSLTLHVQRASARWRPMRLLRGVLEVDELRVDSVDAGLREADAAPADSADGGSRRFAVPLGIAVHELAVRGVRVRTAAGDTLTVDSVLAALDARADTFAIGSLQVFRAAYMDNAGTLQASGRMVTGAETGRDTATLDVAWEGETADGHRVAAQGRVQGAAGRYRLNYDFTEPVRATLAATVLRPWTPDSLAWEARLELPPTALSVVRPELAGEVGGTVVASGAGARIDAELRAGGVYPGAGPVDVLARITYADQVVTVDTLDAVRRGRPTALGGSGTVDLGGPAPAGTLRLAWRELPLGWPMDSASVTSPSGSLRFLGGAADFELTTDLALRSPDRPLGDWSVQASGGYTDSLVVRLGYQGRVPELPAVRGDGRLRYAADRLTVPELDVRMRDRGRLVLTGQVALTDVPRGEVQLRWSDLAWPQAGHPDGFRSPRGRIEGRGALSDFTVAASADFTGWSAPPSRLDVELRGSADTSLVRVALAGRGVAEGAPALDFDARLAYRLADRFLMVDTVDLTLPETGGRLAGRLEADLADPGSQAAGRFRWRDLGWPVHEPAYWSDEGEVTLEGGTGELRVAAGAHLSGRGLPATHWRLVVAGDPAAQMVVDSLRGDLLGGVVEGAGAVWNDSIRRWDLTLRGEGLNPGEWQPEWAGALDFAVRTEGVVVGDSLWYAVALDSLTGTLRDRDVDAVARLEGGARGVAVDTLWLRSGGSSAALRGAVGDSLELAWRVDAETLADFYPHAEGRLMASGRASGPARAPVVAFSARADSLRVSGWVVDSLVASGDVDLEGTSSLEATLRGVAGPSLALDSLSMTADGTRDRHTVTVRAHAPADFVETRLAGGLADDHWDGSLDRLLLRSDQAGEWRLRSPAGLTVGRDTARVRDLCWEGTGVLCLDGRWGPNGASWTGSGRSLPMAFLGLVLPQPLTVQGVFALETEGTAAPGRTPLGTFRFTGEPGTVEYVRDQGQVVTQPYDGFSLNAESDSTGVRADMELRMGALGAIRADVRLPGVGPIQDRPVDGRLSATVNDDGTAARFVEAVTETHGVLRAELDITGQARSPELFGTVTIDSLAASVVPAGIRLRDGTLAARSTESGRWQIDGGLRSDTGRITLGGFVRPPTPDSAWRVEVSVVGERFRAVQIPELVLSASPDLTVVATPDSIHLGGQLRVPRARIAVKRLESTVSASPDVVIVGGAADEDGETSPVAAPAGLWADVRVIPGDSVTIDALGLSGRLEGQLNVTAQPTRPPVGSGELRVLDGRYRIYRQTFQIDRGRLLYANSPLTDPALDLRVTRSRNNVTAGMEITGRATNPRVQLFSEPSLADEEILAYLLVGRPLRSLSQSEGSQVENAAQTIGVAGGNLLLARLSNVFGLEQARLERTTTTEGETVRRETSLVLGRQVLPRVYLDYVIGLTGASNVLRLRYMITGHWILQTESGEETGADLLYSIER